MAFNPTPEQQAAIDARGNVLVSAAAGSGKTAVLVERVINRLTDKVSPVSADRMLIVTFTNAAAAEMRTRIEKRLDAECRSNPDDVGLLRQKRLLGSAKICTIDSFCIDLVRENFEKAGVSPDFKMSDGYSLMPVNEAVLSSILSEYYESGNADFLRLMDIVGAEYDDGDFSDFVLEIYEYSRQLAEPRKWFDGLYEMYNADKFAPGNVWYDYAVKRAAKAADELSALAANAVDLLFGDEKAAKADVTAFSDAAGLFGSLKTAAESGKWDEVFSAVGGLCFPDLPRTNGLSGSMPAKAAKQAWGYFKKEKESLERIFYDDEKSISAGLSELYEPVKLLSEILKKLDTRLFEEYLARNTFTFHNTEHLALKLLSGESENGELLSRYDEVMVDEYQDTNDLQDMLFNILSGGGKRLFAVGDVKQSIYGFRGANPENFLKKINAAKPVSSAGENEPKRIILGCNFRSKPEVCDFINYFFENMMTEKTGSIVYNDNEKLIPAAVYPAAPLEPVQLCIVENKGSAEEKLKCETRRIVGIINETMVAGNCIKQSDGTLRPARYSDFTVLLRSTKNKAPVLAAEMRKHGIPVIFGTEGYAEKREVSAFLSLLKIIDNPDSDVELLTVLLSPVFGFSESDVAKLRTKHKKGSLYSALVFCAENGDGKCKAVLEGLEKYRLLSVTLPLPRLITRLLAETDYLNRVSALEDGERRRNNLLLLVSYAAQYAADNCGTPGGFVNYVLKQSQSGLKSAAALSGGDTVKIMSIHASKGLQFPVCIAADCAGAFNDGESRSPTLYSVSGGIGFRYYDEDKKQKRTTVGREVILDSARRRASEEELRLLYVAMTRTEDRLIFTAAVNDAEKTADEAQASAALFAGRQDEASLRLRSYAKWLCLSAVLHPNGTALRSGGSGIIPSGTKSRIGVYIYSSEADMPELPDSTETDDYIPNAEITESIIKNTAYVYPYAPLLSIESKSSVSALANSAESEKYAFSARPSFMSGGGLSGAGRGTATHKVMEFIDFNKTDDLDGEINRLYEWQFISEREADAVSREKLKVFFESDVFGRIKKSKDVRREMRFITEIPANRIEPGLDSAFDGENVIVQGAVDLCFEEDGEIVVLDFKTDRADNAEMLKSAYGEQLEIYAAACEKIFKKKVKQRIIYSFALSREISV